MKYNARKPEAPQFKTLPPGDYPFRVLDARETTSKTNRPMMEVKLVVGESAEDEVTVFDYRLPGDPKTEWKIDAFLAACGMHPGEKDEVELEANEFIGWTGRVKLKLEKFEGKDRNKVDTYLFGTEEF